MIKIPKKPSFKYKDRFSLVKIPNSLRVFFFLISAAIFYFILPGYLLIQHKVTPARVFLFYLACAFLFFLMAGKNSRKKRSLKLKSESIEEQVNLLTIQHGRELKNQLALNEKISRYKSLKNIIEQINQNLSLEATAASLCDITFSLIAKNKGICILYLVDPLTNKLGLFKTRKEDNKVIIKAKEGDAFDNWVLKHSSPLIVEDVKKDFRFDTEKLKGRGSRGFASLASSPLISENKFLGILRLDSLESNFYSQDDLRFLVTLADLGALALENGELFQRTQDLAIHDGLTGLYTKGYFLERLKEESRRSLRQGSCLSLLMLDIDFFKNYNDKFGHTAGDIVLQKLSLDICEFLKEKSPLISRFGGEEFCVILPRMPKEKALSTAEQLRARIEKLRIILRRQETGVTLSIGVSEFPGDTSDEDDLIIKADRAMYSAKQKGRNRVCGA